MKVTCFFSKLEWDQFEVNKKKFGVETTYNDDLYTTKLDKKSEFYRQKSKLAERIAEEIERVGSNNIQSQLDRGIGLDRFTEEEMFSSVARKEGKYLPPQRRKDDAKLDAAERKFLEKQILLDRNR